MPPHQSASNRAHSKFEKVGVFHIDNISENQSRKKPSFVSCYIMIAMQHKKKLLIITFFGLLIFTMGGVWILKNNRGDLIYVQFESEIYDSIKTNYWDKISDENLSNLFKLGVEKITGKLVMLSVTDKNSVEKLVADSIKNLAQNQKKEFVATLGNLVLANLQPFGRSSLYTEKQEIALRDTVANVDKSKDLYVTLDVPKTATEAEVKKQSAKQISVLSKENTPEAKQKIADIKYAESVLTNTDQKQRYDSGKIEPTVFQREISPKIFYVRMSKISPTTFDEFLKTIQDNAKNTSQNSLILDLRGNIGGAIDLLPYFFGLFVGQNQYIYDFFQQGNYTPFRTKIGKLSELEKYRKNVVLIDSASQSTVEDMTAVFKKFNLAVVVGIPSKGWGTIENTYPLKTVIDPAEKYSLFLVNSITLRDDGQPIESRGVEPNINITDKNWAKQLDDYFNYPELTAAVKKILAEPVK